MFGFIFGHPFLIVSSVAFGFLAWFFVIRMYLLRRKLPPGPFPIPIFGNLLFFCGTKDNIGITIKHLTKVFGDPITIWFGNWPMIFLHKTESVREYLIDNPHDFQDRPDTLLGRIFLDGTQDIIFAPYNALWQFHKKLANKAMRRIVESSALEWHANEAVDEVVVKMLKESKPITLRNYTTSTVTNIINSFCFGERLPMEDPYFKKRMAVQDRFNEIQNQLNTIELIPGIRYFKEYVEKYIPIAKETKNLLGDNKSFCRKKLIEHKKDFNFESAESGVRDILDAVLYEQHVLQAEGKTDESMTDEHVLLLLLDIFVAGIETSSVTLQWFFLEMMLNPEIQEGCYNYIRQAIGDRSPSLSDRQKLPYVEACILETLRCHPVAPMGVPTCAVKDVNFGKYYIPKGSMIVTNLFGLHFDPAYWKDPQTFNPDRFVENGSVIKPPMWLPFGVGKRVCLGETLAKNDLFLIVTGLLQKVKFVCSPNEHYTLDSVSADFNNVPATAYTAVVQKR